MGIFDLFKQIESGSAGNLHGKLTWIVAGLGNPGLEYENTRHNAGFLTMDELAKQCGVKLDQMKFKSDCGEAMLGEVRCLLMKPTTYMNLSGDAIAAAANFYKIPPEQVLVIYDDISLPPGKTAPAPKGQCPVVTTASRALSPSWEQRSFHGSGWVSAQSPIPSMIWRTGCCRSSARKI